MQELENQTGTSAGVMPLPGDHFHSGERTEVGTQGSESHSLRPGDGRGAGTGGGLWAFSSLWKCFPATRCSSGPAGTKCPLMAMFGIFKASVGSASPVKDGELCPLSPKLPLPPPSLALILKAGRAPSLSCRWDGHTREPSHMLMDRTGRV